MRETIAIFGTGPGLGLSVAHRFGREGFRVALVARNEGRLKEFTATLAENGIEATAFPADISDPGQLTATIAAIGRIDVVTYSPAAKLDGPPTAVLDLTPEKLASHLEFPLMTPISLVRQVLPGMLERGNGGILMALGISATHPMPGLASLGIGHAALRNYLHSLHTELAGRGVYAGALIVAGLIDRSDVAGSFDTSALPASARLDPDDLADAYWDLHAKRDRFEEVAGTFGL